MRHFQPPTPGGLSCGQPPARFSEIVDDVQSAKQKLRAPYDGLHLLSTTETLKGTQLATGAMYQDPVSCHSS